MTQDAEGTKNLDTTRMDAENAFRFACHPGVSCFTKCCRDVTIVLTPYDVLRLKNALSMSSEEFIDRHTIIIPKEDRLIPMVALRMNEDDKKCSLVSEKGCLVYDDRPWACRMYPLDMNDDGTFRLITDSSKCKGLDEDTEQRISDWLIEQGIAIYEDMNNLLSQVTTPLSGQDLDINNPKIYKMIFMALYNIDKFRDFIFKSSFLDKFAFEDTEIEKIKRNDTDLLKLSFDWIKFGILGQKTLQIKPEAADKVSNRNR